MGVIGRALGIPVTDNKMQAWPSVKAYYDLMRQPTIRYPVDIIELDAHEAVKRYRPQVVIGSYITHRWRPGMTSGNQYGVDNLKIARKVEAYYMIGSLTTHMQDPAMKHLDGIERHDFLYTRGGKENSVIFRWKRTYLAYKSERPADAGRFLLHHLKSIHDDNQMRRAAPRSGNTPKRSTTNPCRNVSTKAPKLGEERAHAASV